MPTPAQARIDASMQRLDHVIDQRLRREEQALAADNADREAARRQRQRDNAEQRRQIQVTYSDAFASFGSDVPAPADDESPARYRVRLFNRLARRLPESHEWASTRADDLPLGPAMDNIEAMIIHAAKAEGERPSFDNLPSSGELISRVRTDEDSGAKATHWYGRESFVKQLSTPAQNVLRIMNPRTGEVLAGPVFPRR
jgi:hypothetical protein